MRLLKSNSESIQIEQFGDSDTPPYAILSHTWENDNEEITFKDVTEGDYATKRPVGLAKIRGTCARAAADGFEYVWIDTCCIDKSSSAELSEAINSMYYWYQQAEVCYAYLADAPFEEKTGHDGCKFLECRWFRRGWTLQELIAPSEVIFFNREWREVGTKSSLQHIISNTTGIPVNILLGDDPGHASIAQRMSWAAKRETKRIEDRAYCLMGIFGVNMPLLYGERENAYIRLQEEIMKISDDHSIFAWRSLEAENYEGLLATSPVAFTDSRDFVPFIPFNTSSKPATVSSKGIQLELSFMGTGHPAVGLAMLHCREIGKKDLLIAVYLQDVSLTMEQFKRAESGKLELVNPNDFNPLLYPIRQMYVCVRGERPRSLKKFKKGTCVVEVEGVRDYASASGSQIHLQSGWKLCEGGLTLEVPHSDGIFGRLIIFCKDGFSFRLLLEQCGGNLSARAVSGIKSDGGSSHNAKASKLQQDGRGLTGAGDAVHVATQKRVQRNRVINIVRIDYQPPHIAEAETWLECMFAIGEGADEEELLSIAGCGPEAIVKALLARSNYKVDFADSDSGCTPLLRAAETGNERVAKLLLDKGAQPGYKDKEGRSPLLCAAKNGHEATFRLLAQRNVDTNSKAKGKTTPLHLAAGGGHEALVKELLASDEVDPSLKDMDGWTPLLMAVRNGHAAVVKELLTSRKVKPDFKDRSGKTLLHLAATYGHVAVVKELLTLDLNSKDRDGCTPLRLAAEHGYEAVVWLLLTRADVRPDSEDNSGRVPLLSAAKNGHLVVLKQLLATGKVNPDSKDKDEKTPLHWAGENGHEAVVAQLLRTSRVDPNSKDKSGRTPLWVTVSNRHAAAVKELLSTGIVDPDIKDKAGWTPLQKAVENGDAASVKELVVTGRVNLDSEMSDGLTSLQKAVSCGYVAVVKELLATGRVDPNSKDPRNDRPLLHVAAWRGDVAVVRELLATGRVNPNSRDPKGRLPLWEAAWRGDLAMVKELLATSGVDPNSKDRDLKSTPLQVAASSGHNAVVEELLATGGIDPDSITDTRYEGHSIAWACSSGW